MTEDVLLYDADCGFCSRCARWLGEHAPSLQVRPMQSVDLGPLGVDAERALREVPFVRADGDVVYGAAAIAESLARCGGALRMLGSVLRKPLALRVAHPVYVLVAGNRHRMPGGTAACALSPESPRLERVVVSWVNRRESAESPPVAGDSAGMPTTGSTTDDARVRAGRGSRGRSRPGRRPSRR